MATAMAVTHDRFFVQPEEQEAYALRVFHRFPELFHTLGDPSLPALFDLSRSFVDLQDSGEQIVLRVQLHRAEPQATPLVFDVSTPQMEPKRPSDPLSVAFSSLEPLHLSEQGSENETQQPRKPTSTKPERARSPVEKKRMERGLMQKSTPALQADLSILGESGGEKERPQAVKVQEPALSRNRSYDDEDEAWHPGQSSDEELTQRMRSRHTVKPLEVPGSASPMSSEGFGSESPFFPFKTGSKSLSSSSSTSTNAAVPHLPRTPSIFRDVEGASSRSLAGRRGLQLQLNKRRATPASVAEDDIDSNSLSPSNSMGVANSGVQLVSPPRRLSRTKTLPADLRHVQSRFVRPRPVAFPQRRNVIFFDWDDTLCPTSWIRKLLKEHLADAEEWLDEDLFLPREEEDWRDSIPSWFTQPLPDEPHIREIIKEVQSSCIKLIQVANSFGLVCIVTNAVPGWVDKTIKRWLPELRSYIGSGSAHCERPIKVIYAQKAYVEVDATLPFADEQGEYMLWKKAAMTGVLEELDSLYCSECEGPRYWQDAGNKRIANVLSIGDTEAEMMAAQLASVDFDCSRYLPRMGKQYCRDCGLEEPAGLPSSVPPRSFSMFSEDGVQSSGSEGFCFAKDPQPEPQKKLGGGYRHSVGVPWSGRWPWVKLIKLHEGCQGRRLATQMDEMCELLPKMIALRQHVRVNLDDDRKSRHSGWQFDALNCTEEDLQLERRLRIGTV